MWNILSTMESTSPTEALQQLDVVRAADESTYAPRPIPRWYFPGIAVSMAALWALQDVGSRALMVGGVFAYSVAIGTLIGVVNRKQGRHPRMRKMPAALQRHVAKSALLLFVILGVCFSAVWGLKLSRPWLWVGGIGFVIMNISGPLMERSYRRAYERWLITK
jgi:hypothetical protein